MNPGPTRSCAPTGRTRSNTHRIDFTFIPHLRFIKEVLIFIFCALYSLYSFDLLNVQLTQLYKHGRSDQDLTSESLIYVAKIHA